MTGRVIMAENEVISGVGTFCGEHSSMRLLSLTHAVIYSESEELRWSKDY